MILLVCGPPGTGKTTVAEAVRERLRAEGYDFELLHSDDFSRNAYDQMYERVSEDPRDNWILDGTFYEREYQERFRALPDAHLIHVTASLETCLERNRKRESPIDERGVYAMHGQFEAPANPDLTLDTERLSVEEAAAALERYVVQWNGEP